MKISFFVAGQAKPAGSKRGFALKQGGHFTGRVIVTDACKESKNWKAQVRMFATQHLPKDFQIVTGPLRVAFTFYRDRPSGHSGVNGLNKKGRENPHPIARPDALKLARGVEDALTGVIWQDDSQIVTETLRKRWGKPGVMIEIESENEPAPQPFNPATSRELGMLV